MADYLRKYERLFMVTPQQLRMVVEAFIDALEAGLVEEGQCVPMIPTFVFGSELRDPLRAMFLKRSLSRIV